MKEFIQAGGVPMWFVIVFGAVALVAAALFVWRPEARKVAVLRSLDNAVLWSALGGMVAAFAAVGYNVPVMPGIAKSGDLPLILLVGLAESMSAPILGFTILSLTALLQAVGHRRLGRLPG